jgi:hypothetical protein
MGGWVTYRGDFRREALDYAERVSNVVEGVLQRHVGV